MAISVVSFAPGRVELLGNHTDYNEGLVMSAAIDLGVTIRAEHLDDEVLEVSSETNRLHATASLVRPERLAGDSAWANYPLGTVWALREMGLHIGGLRLHVTSTLPLGWGLSSSAAFEVATALAALKLYDLSLEPMTLAKICQKAENEFVGVQCGLLDQASSVFGEDGRAIVLDFREVSARTVP
ncbi:MAG: galactokinase, partial [Verrucomicrobia bacterium]|nr:galactokinase [Verrucomicrobiota bacterium]